MSPEDRRQMIVRAVLPLVVEHGAAVTTSQIARAASIGDGFIAGIRAWDTTRTEIDWYRSAGGTGPIVLRSFLVPGGTEDPVRFSEAAIEAVDARPASAPTSSTSR